MTLKAPITLAPTLPRPELSLRFAAEKLASICALIENGADPRSAVIQSMFSEARGGLSTSVDAAIEFKRGLDAEETKAEQAIKYWRARKAMVRSMHDAFDEKLLSTMTDHPDMPYRGELEGFAVKSNPPSVELAWDGKDLTAEMISFYDIPETFVRVKTKYEVSKSAIAVHLKSGGTLEWAKLKQDKRVTTE